MITFGNIQVPIRNTLFIPGVNFFFAPFKHTSEKNKRKYIREEVNTLE